uniref:Uncharacterized protein n=1 Tax=Oryza punctata TaxID=4537 RepID=A0A0E0K811_ORYPU
MTGALNAGRVLEQLCFATYHHADNCPEPNLSLSGCLIQHKYVSQTEGRLTNFTEYLTAFHWLVVGMTVSTTRYEAGKQNCSSQNWKLIQVEVLCLPLAEAADLSVDDNVGTQGDQLTVGLHAGCIHHIGCRALASTLEHPERKSRAHASRQGPRQNLHGGACVNVT